MITKAFLQAEFAINITDPNGYILKVNEAYLKLYGFSSDQEVIGKSQNIIRSPATPNRVYESLWSTIKSGQTWKGDLTNLSKNGREVYVHLTVSPLMEDGEIVGYMGFSLNREQQVILERQLFHANKLVVLRTLCASLTHELNNPLASILLDAEYLKEVVSYPDEEVDYKAALSAADSIIKGAKWMDKVLNHLRQYTGKELDADLKVIPVVELIHDSLLFLEKQFLARQIKVKVEVEEGLSVSGNRTQLESVIHNLLSNSRDAFEKSPPGNKFIGIQAKKSRGGTACIRYIDNAGGIDPTLLPKIFDPFFTTKQGSEDTRLRLSLSRKIILEHNGSIIFHSKKGGTFFKINLPLALITRAAPNRSLSRNYY